MEIQNSNEYKFCTFDKENAILYHKIVEENCGTKEQFVLSMSYFATLIGEYQPKYIILIINKKPSYFEYELSSFMDKAFYKIITELHIPKIACVFQNQAYLPDLNRYDKKVPFQVILFTDLDEAKNWVLKKE